MPVKSPLALRGTPPHTSQVIIVPVLTSSARNPNSGPGCLHAPLPQNRNDNKLRSRKTAERTASHTPLLSRVRSDDEAQRSNCKHR
ncbi:hypothetical protein GWI33_019876 [Rhynchophorus ferrugineus]|uniref:Uncharacterized protein n=1 Tax=Rhynchophorus ferrugineus TaxID=354439 RepID=A0A834M3V8_RHYFE|nr:hypothetical protein GWI33_019876 [Rhynchophorus ferrugineus]